VVAPRHPQGGEPQYAVRRNKELGSTAARIDGLHKTAIGARAAYDLQGALAHLREVVDLAKALTGEGVEFLEAYTQGHETDTAFLRPPLRWTPEAEKRLSVLERRARGHDGSAKPSVGRLSDTDIVVLKAKLLRAVKIGNDALLVIKGIEEEEAAVAGFLGYKKGAERRNELASLNEELRRTRAILREYPNNPALAGVTRPLLVTTEPRGARVFVNGELRGTAPREGLVVRFPVVGSHMVRAERTGYSVVTQAAPRDRIKLHIPLTRKWAWRFESEAKVLSMATGPRGLLLVANRDGVLAAVDPSSSLVTSDAKDSTWSLVTLNRTAGITSGIAVQGDAVYCGSEGLYALDVGERPEWRWDRPVSMGGRIPAPPVAGRVELLKKNLVFGTYTDAQGAGRVWAVDSASGQPTHWSPKMPAAEPAPTSAQILYRGNLLYVPFDNGVIHALQAASGEVAGSWKTGSRTRLTSIAWDGRHGWVGTGEGRLCRIDLDTPGSPARRFDVARSGLTDLVVRDRIAYCGDDSGHLHAFSLEKQAPVWPAFKGQGSVTAPPVVSDRRVYFATDLGWVYAVDRATGRLVNDLEEPIGWKFPLEQDVSGGLLFDGRYLYAGGLDGYVYAFDEQGNP